MSSPNGDRREFERFVSSAVAPQRQKGFSTVHIHIPRDLTPEQFRGLRQIMRDYTGGYARTTVHQNLVLRRLYRGFLLREELRLLYHLPTQNSHPRTSKPGSPGHHARACGPSPASRAPCASTATASSPPSVSASPTAASRG